MHKSNCQYCPTKIKYSSCTFYVWVMTEIRSALWWTSLVQLCLDLEKTTVKINIKSKFNQKTSEAAVLLWLQKSFSKCSSISQRFWIVFLHCKKWFFRVINKTIIGYYIRFTRKYYLQLFCFTTSNFMFNSVCYFPFLCNWLWNLLEVWFLSGNCF